MKRVSIEQTVTNNPSVYFSAEEHEEEEPDYVNSAAGTVIKIPASSDKKTLSNISPSLCKSCLPIAVCWAILLVIMTLRIHFTTVISTKLRNEMKASEDAKQRITDVVKTNENLHRSQSDVEVKIDKLYQAYTVLENNITNLWEENRQLREENRQLIAENQKLREGNQISTVTPHLAVTNLSWTTHTHNRTQTHLFHSTTTIGWNDQSINQTSPQWKYNYRKKRQSEYCQTGWIHFQSSCYVINHRELPDQKTWEDARDDCRGKNADLVVIEYPEEQDFIYNSSLVSLGMNGYWIGLRGENGSWNWVSGSRLIKEYWIQPPGDSQHCVTSVKETKGWKAVSCDVKNGWICEKNTLSF
ncbi:asialoglycoprotein receptor 2 [Lates calcarifer]|uniref:Asialoglycoprotein receptor 2 n=1 Tax=Lates calcarifer TaxID=8187 RepID=A0AAJ7L7Z0_LATCA|nr:asialoglycoprotein receptor 2 [Lates calcarifer]